MLLVAHDWVRSMRLQVEASVQRLDLVEECHKSPAFSRRHRSIGKKSRVAGFKRRSGKSIKRDLGNRLRRNAFSQPARELQLCVDRVPQRSVLFSRLVEGDVKDRG